MSRVESAPQMGYPPTAVGESRKRWRSKLPEGGALQIGAFDIALARASILISRAERPDRSSLTVRARVRVAVDKRPL